jgi:hypothetical protein
VSLYNFEGSQKNLLKDRALAQSAIHWVPQTEVQMVRMRAYAHKDCVRLLYRRELRPIRHIPHTHHGLMVLDDYEDRDGAVRRATEAQVVGGDHRQRPFGTSTDEVALLNPTLADRHGRERARSGSVGRH